MYQHISTTLHRPLYKAKARMEKLNDSFVTVICYRHYFVYKVLNNYYKNNSTYTFMEGLHVWWHYL